MADASACKPRRLWEVGVGWGVEQYVSPGRVALLEGGKVTLLRVQLIPRFPRVR